MLHLCVLVQAGERLMVDVCTHCECTVEDGAVRKYRLSCKRISCANCPMVTVIPSLFLTITIIILNIIIVIVFMTHQPITTFVIFIKDVLIR